MNAKDRRGWTVLHDAAFIGRKETAELLIAKGADVNAKDNDRLLTALHHTVLLEKREPVDWGNKEIAGLLTAHVLLAVQRFPCSPNQPAHAFPAKPYDAKQSTIYHYLSHSHLHPWRLVVQLFPCDR